VWMQNSLLVACSGDIGDALMRSVDESEGGGRGAGSAGGGGDAGGFQNIPSRVVEEVETYTALADEVAVLTVGWVVQPKDMRRSS
jgi:hypothetical protein